MSDGGKRTDPALCTVVDSRGNRKPGGSTPPIGQGSPPIVRSSAAAGYLPARRAAAIDPMRVLNVD